MSVNEDLVRRAYDAVNLRQLDLLKEFCSSDFVCHFTPSMSRLELEPQRRDLDTLIGAFPDYHVAIDDAVSQNDKIAVRLTVSGTHLGIFYGKSATGRKVSWGPWRFLDHLTANLRNNGL